MKTKTKKDPFGLTLLWVGALFLVNPLINIVDILPDAAGYILMALGLGKISAMNSYGFNELNGDWSLGMSDTILFDKNDARLRPESETQIQSMASRLAETGLNHARMDGHTDNYGEESYNEALSLKRANAVADA